jgi:hypothetical protein
MLIIGGRITMGLGAISAGLGARGTYAALTTASGGSRATGNDGDGDDMGAGPAASVQISAAALQSVRNAKAADGDGDGS